MATAPAHADRDGSPPADPARLGHANGLGGGGHSNLQKRLHRHLLTILSSRRGELLSEEDLRVELSRLAEEAVDDEGRPLDPARQHQAVQEVLHEVFGYGPLEGLMRDHEITDILINGPRQLYYEKSGQLFATDVAFRDDEHLMQVLQRMFTGAGRAPDEKARMVDARLPDGSRVNVVLNPPALNGPLVSIRRFGMRPLTAEDLIANESLAREMLDFLGACVKARINIVISGGTGTGKTTLLNALSRYVSDTERVVTIEDTAELQLQQRHVAKMEAVVGGPDGTDAITMRDLVRNSLRMRPDRVIVGECRGAEVLDMLQAMNTGHDGTLTTVHANDPRAALARIELMAALANVDLPVWAVRKLISSSIQLVVQVNRVPGGRRKVASIAEITGMESETVSMQTLFEFVQTGVDAAQAVVGHFRATGIRPRFLERLRARGTGTTPQLFVERVLQPQATGGPRR
jgi:pilus assembly protein CpaF